jgi:hypothetical protein
MAIDSEATDERSWRAARCVAHNSWERVKEMTKGSSRRWVRLGLALAIAGGVVVALVTQTAASSPAASKKASKSYVAGSGVREPITVGSEPFVFSVNAAPGKNGIFGTLKGSFENFASFTGVVTCLHISGNTATVGGVFTSGYGYDDDFSEPQHDLTGDWFIWIVQDNGPSKHGPSPDMASSFDWGDRGFFTAGGSNPSTSFPTFDALCDNAVDDVGTDLFPLVSGEITVR